MPNKAPQGRRMPFVAANWKMNKTVDEAEDFVERFIGSISDFKGVEVALCPPFTALATVVERTRRSQVEVLAQNVHFEDSGAFTGEISIPMLIDVGAAGAIVGHSERRQLFGETDEALARKVPALLDAGLIALLCCGETEAERDADETEAVLERQITADLAAVADGDLGRVVIAYEPIWAIGTGRTATAEQAEEACAFIRDLIAARDAAAGEAVRILYGGSVKPANAGELFALENVDGGLVGGAALKAEDFLEICRGAA
jgi:triosephosphate isomerase (TIM)